MDYFPTYVQRCIVRYVLLVICAVGTGPGVRATTYTVLNANDNGAGSLRQAITNANGAAGTDTILFNIAGAGVHTINLSSALPSITRQVFINGYSQPGTSQNTQYGSDNATLLIALNGGGSGFVGLRLASGSGGSRIQGLNLHSFSNASIRIDVGSDGSTIAGNFIGTNAAGTASVGNGNGIQIYSADNWIGGNAVRDRNLISGNAGGAGILITGASAQNNTVLANFMGLAANGSTVIGGLQNGFTASAGCTNNTFGGTNGSDPNMIAGTTQQGIVVLGAATQGIDLQSNQVFQAGGVAFDLNGDGQTPNDPGDGDAGPNGLTNYPQIVRAYTDQQGAYYAEILYQGAAGHGYRLDWYLVGTPHASGHGDALTWIGRTSGSTDGGGTMSQHFTFGQGLHMPAGTMLTVSITDYSTNSTSELAQNVALQLGELKVTNNSDVVNGNTTNVIELILAPGADGISLREAILAGNETTSSWGEDHIVFDIPGPGPHTIQPLTPLPPLRSQWEIDGYTEPGYSGSPLIIIDGSLAGAGAHGLRVERNWCYIYALSIVNFDGNGVHITESNGELASMYIGVMPDGTTPAGNNGYGVRIEDTFDWEVGKYYRDQNVISANAEGGVRFSGANSYAGHVVNSLIGTNASGTSVCGVQSSGIRIDDGANDVEIGDGTSDGRNVISGNTLKGIHINDPTTFGNRVIGNYIGTDIAGGLPLGNGDDGVTIDDASDNIVGGISVGERNVISANGEDGIDISYAGTSNNRVIGNYVGLGADGTTPLGNVDDGIAIESDATSNIIGGSTPAEQNIVSSNGGDGIKLQNGGSNLVRGNLIGVDASGLLDRGNVGNGILMRNTAANVIGGSSSQRNIISGNTENGISVSGIQSTGNSILGNYIGLDINGAVALPNQSGVSFTGDATNNSVGSAAGQGNVISGNTQVGVFVEANDNVILGNTIGMDAAAATDIANGWQGILIGNADDTEIGNGTVLGRNYISGNNSDGIRVQGNSSGTRMRGNYIGTNGAGNAAVENLQNGIAIIGGSNSTMVGGIVPGEGNLIMGNRERGIDLNDGTTISNSILGNSIYDNGDLGIDLNSDDVTLNDANDVDGGPNGTLNFPVLANAHIIGPNLVLSGFARPGSTVEVFISDGDATGFGEGETFLFTALEGSGADADATSGTYGPAAINGLLQGTDNTNRFSFTVPVPGGVVDGSMLTATATLAGNTSEFSGVVEVITPEICGNGTDDDGDGLTDCEDPDCYLASNTGEPNSDGDLIGNNCDLDDDNDGIPDSVENAVSYTSFQPACNALALDLTGPPTLVSGTDLQQGAVYKYSTVSAGIDVILTIVRTYNNTLAELDDDLTDPAFFKPKSGFNLTAIGDQAYTEFKFEFVTGVAETPVIIPELFVNYNDIDGNADYGEENWTQYPVSYTVADTTVLTTTVEDWVVSTASSAEVIGSSNASPGANFSARYLSLSELTIRAGVVARIAGANSTGRNHSIQFACMSNFLDPTTYLLDFDEDGIINKFDLDSDNDGIYDVVESGSGQPFTSGVLNGSVTANGIPVSVDADANDVVDYTISDSDSDGNIDSMELDSDGDLCSDVIEAGYIDHNDDGELGDVPLTVDGNGLVTSGGP